MNDLNDPEKFKTLRGIPLVVLPGVDEQNQPPVIGFASNFHVAPINGKQFMHGDLHIYPEHVSKIREYPFRSIERLEPPHGTDW